MDKENIIKECKRQLFGIDTYLKLSAEQMEIVIEKIKMDLEEVVAKHKIQKNCENKEASFILSKFRFQIF